MTTAATAPSAAIILVNWNGWRDTCACLESLRELKYPRFHTIVVDNGSTDDSLKRISAGFPDVQCIATGRNLGFAGGNNIGIREALASDVAFIWVLNNDTTVAPDSLTALVAAAEADSRIGAVGSIVQYLDDPSRVQIWGGGRYGVWNCIVRVSTRPGPIDYIPGASVLLRAAAIREVGPFDEGFFFSWEDVDLCHRLRRAGWRLAVAESSRVWHKKSSSSGSYSYGWGRQSGKGLVRFARKHAPCPLVPLVVGLLGTTGYALARGRYEFAKGVLRGWLEGLSTPV